MREKIIKQQKKHVNKLKLDYLHFLDLHCYCVEESSCKRNNQQYPKQLKQEVGSITNMTKPAKRFTPVISWIDKAKMVEIKLAKKNKRDKRRRMLR
jgi:hypothetical protein